MRKYIEYTTNSDHLEGTWYSGADQFVTNYGQYESAGWWYDFFFGEWRYDTTGIVPMSGVIFPKSNEEPRTYPPIPLIDKDGNNLPIGTAPLRIAVLPTIFQDRSVCYVNTSNIIGTNRCCIESTNGNPNIAGTPWQFAFAFGIVFRYKDEGNFYSIYSTHNRRFFGKMVDGVWSTIWSHWCLVSNVTWDNVGSCNYVKIKGSTITTYKMPESAPYVYTLVDTIDDSIQGPGRVGIMGFAEPVRANNEIASRFGIRSLIAIKPGEQTVTRVLSALGTYPSYGGATPVTTIDAAAIDTGVGENDYGVVVVDTTKLDYAKVNPDFLIIGGTYDPVFDFLFAMFFDADDQIMVDDPSINNDLPSLLEEAP